MREEIIFVVVVFAALFAFVRAIIFNKYRDDLNQVPPQSVIPMLIAFKKKRPTVGLVLIVASVLQICCFAALAIVLLLQLFM
ncbi:MAG: hypothetical protein WAO71_00010 [Gallionella sp.]